MYAEQSSSSHLRHIIVSGQGNFLFDREGIAQSNNQDLRPRHDVLLGFGTKGITTCHVPVVHMMGGRVNHPKDQLEVCWTSLMESVAMFAMIQIEVVVGSSSVLRWGRSDCRFGGIVVI